MVQARSLLTAHEDYTTLQFHAGQEIQRPGFVFTSLRRHLSDEVVEQIKGITLTTDGKSAIFDVPSGIAQVSPAVALVKHPCTCELVFRMPCALSGSASHGIGPIGWGRQDLEDALN